MLRDGRRRLVDERPLSETARLLLLEDHRRGLHSKPEDQCALCLPAGAVDDMAAATS